MVTYARAVVTNCKMIRDMKNFRTNLIKIAIAVLISSIGLFSCKKDNSARPATLSGSQIAFGVKADNALSPASASKQTVNAVTPPITWAAGLANIAKVKFEARANGVEKEFTARGLKNVDLFAFDPSFVSTIIDTGTFTNIEVKLELEQSNTADIPLNLTGNFTRTDGTIVPVEFDVNQNLEIKAEAEHVFIDKTTDLKTTLILHLNLFFQGITAAQLENADLTNGKIIISSTSNIALFNKAISNIQNNGGEAHFEGEHQRGGNNNNGGSGNGGNDDHSGDDNHGGGENDG